MKNIMTSLCPICIQGSADLHIPQLNRLQENKEGIQQFKGTGSSRYQNESDKHVLAWLWKF